MASWARKARRSSRRTRSATSCSGRLADARWPKAYGELAWRCRPLIAFCPEIGVTLRLETPATGYGLKPQHAIRHVATRSALPGKLGLGSGELPAERCRRGERARLWLSVPTLDAMALDTDEVHPRGVGPPRRPRRASRAPDHARARYRGPPPNLMAARQRMILAMPPTVLSPG